MPASSPSSRSGPDGSTASTKRGVAALRDQLDVFWNRALTGFQDLTDQPSEEEQ